MDDLTAVLSSLISDQVRFYELVKVTIHSYTRKLYILIADRGIYLVTYNLSGIIKDSKILYSNINRIYLVDNNTKIVISLKRSLIEVEDSDLAIDEILIDTPNYAHLYDRIKIACDTNYMINNYKEPLEEEDEEKPNTNIVTILPFNGYKKIILSNYYFFVKDTFKDTTFNTLYVTRLEDDRGISLSVNIKDLVPIHHLELNEPDSLYNYSRDFLEEIKLICNEGRKETYSIPYEIIKDEIYYKKMKLNNDIALWSGYHIVIRTCSRFIAFFILRRLYIPPLLDVCQDISVRFECKYEPSAVINFNELWNEFCITVNSFTANSDHFICLTRQSYITSVTLSWSYPEINERKEFDANQDLIQVRVDNLRFERQMYTFLKLTYGIVPSYYKLVKEFIGSLLKLFPPVAIDPRIIVKFGDTSSFLDDPMEYIYRITTQIYGIGNGMNTNIRKILINNFKMRLADYITYCIEELSNENLMNLITNSIVHADDIARKKIDEVIMFLMHFRTVDYTEEYKQNVFENLIAVYKSEQGTTDWDKITFNQFSVSCFLGYIGVFMSDEDAYVKLLSMLIENINGYSILKRIFRKLLELPTPTPKIYLPLVPALVNILKYQLNSNITNIMLSVLINFSYHGDEFKEDMIKSHIAIVIVNYLLYDDETVILTLKLITNLTKCKSHQECFIDAGVFSNLVHVAENNYNRNSNVIAYVAGVIGQLTNSNYPFPQHKLEYITDIMIYTFHTGAGSIENFTKILFCLKKLLFDKATVIKVGRHCIHTLVFNLKYEKECDYILNVFELLYELANVVQNCKIMIKHGLIQSIRELSIKTDTIIQASIRLIDKVRKKTLHCTDLTIDAEQTNVI